jgi:hypothetical protein
MAEAIAVPSLRGRDLNGRAVMVFIFCMTLLSNSSTLRFIPNLVVNSVGFILWCIAANSSALTGRTVHSQTDMATYSFFVFAGSLCNIVASYVRENYQRRVIFLTIFHLFSSPYLMSMDDCINIGLCIDSSCGRRKRS